MDEHYKTLGVRKHADQKEIKDQYRYLSKKYHPDKGGDEERFKEIARAYEILGDCDRRKLYDATGSDITEEGLDRKAEGLLQQIFQVIVTESGLVKIQHMDVIAEINNKIDSGMIELDKNIENARKSRKEIGNVLRRVRHKDKYNPISSMLKHEIQKHTENITKSKHEKEVGKRSRKILTEYGYDFEKKESEPVTWNRKFTNFANFSNVVRTGESS